ncbi:GNAT family N-acetyltransferase [Streptomyces sp. NBC_00335]|uniref:GNAT family N-acetyltransferase n=1 Tax=unclassified Streptomyces TaxID=2593676 RepID=UPI00225A5F63|nr:MULTISPECIES: GNAT family N-acetyltransferase [unclassified Streptomyces]MCX5404008.1 GNAT family N-acetyltransferase [Streptomyces sp. NBC_00086]
MLLAHVRTAASNDATSISHLLAEGIRDSYCQILGRTGTERLVSDQCALPRLRAEIEMPGGAPGWLGWLVAADADGIIHGVASGGVAVPTQGEIYALCTAPGRRRKGVGTALLAAVTIRMVAYGATSQRIGLPIEQDPALPFFTHHGFALVTPLRLGRTL